MDLIGDSLRISNSNRSLEARVICHKKQSISYLVASASKGLSQNTLKCVTAIKQRIQGNATASEIVVFLVTTAALEVVRRFSRATCPFIWRVLQALQIFSYPPFKWIERWDPFKGFIKHTKVDLLELLGREMYLYYYTFAMFAFFPIVFYPGSNTPFVYSTRNCPGQC
jgi:hypothetical protein